MIVEKDTDPNFKLLESLMHYINDHVVKAGYIGNDSKNKRKNAKADNVLLAAVHNFGSPQKKIPARPTMAPAFEKNQAIYNKMADNAVMKSISANSKDVFDKSIGQIGEKMKQDIQKEIREIMQPALKNVTIKARQRKYSKAYAKNKDWSKPLIDSGDMLKSTTYAKGKNI